ncbi:phage holin family protein [Paenibacillus sp. y28]|uniref:phage holin family protein n=1 Tax=Paenibacillus sp. y28 TaxID=3129110 RepID=UPI0030195B53
MNQTIVNSLAGVFGAAFTYAFGAWNELFGLLLLVMAIDYISGLAASLKENKGLSSEVGFWGLWKKGLMLMVIMLGHRADLLLDINIVMYGAIYFYLSNELISVMENYGRMGLPLPKQIKRIIEVLKEREEPPGTPPHDK